VPARPGRERAQSVAEAWRLRQEGLLLREIGVELGVSAKTVHAWLSDPEGSKARERKRRYRAVCVDCGGPCFRQGPYVEAWRCETCQRTHRHEPQVDQAQGQGGAGSLGRRSRPTADSRGDRPARHAGSLPGDPARVRQLQQVGCRPLSCPRGSPGTVAERTGCRTAPTARGLMGRAVSGRRQSAGNDGLIWPQCDGGNSSQRRNG
jgi:hypothetical protein